MRRCYALPILVALWADLYANPTETVEDEE